MGRSWRIAGMVDTHALPIQSTPAEWFDPVNAFDWVVAAPAGLIETTDSGRTWTLTRSPIAVSGQPASFTSPADGFIQGAGLVIAMRTGDGGRTWSPESASISSSLQASWSQGDGVSTIQVVGPHLAVAAGATGVMTSSDGGRSWVDRLGDQLFGRRSRLHQHPRGLRRGERGARANQSNGGVSWQALLHPVAGGVSGIEFWSASAGLVSVGSQSLFVTSDGGTSWQPLRLPPGWIVSDAFIGGGEPTGICFTDKGVGWAAGEPRSPFWRLRQHKRWAQLEARAVICRSCHLEPNPTSSEVGVSIAGCQGEGGLDSRLASCRADGHAGRTYHLRPSAQP